MGVPEGLGKDWVWGSGKTSELELGNVGAAE